MSTMTSEREAFEWFLAKQMNDPEPMKDRKGAYRDPETQACWATWRAARAHLAQPGQGVDVVAYLAEDTGKPMSREIVDLHFPTDADKAKARLTPLTRTLSGEKAGPGWKPKPITQAPENAPSHSIELLVYLPEYGWRRGFYTGFYAERGKWPWSAEAFSGIASRTITHWEYLPASPTPDKEG